MFLQLTVQQDEFLKALKAETGFEIIKADVQVSDHSSGRFSELPVQWAVAASQSEIMSERVVAVENELKSVIERAPE